jgi:phage-related holin
VAEVLEALLGLESAEVAAEVTVPQAAALMETPAPLQPLEAVEAEAVAVKLAEQPAELEADLELLESSKSAIGSQSNKKKFMNTFLSALTDSLMKFLSMLVLILMPIHSTLIAISVLVVADLITGLWAAKREKQPITSSGLKKTIAKTLAYQTTIIVAFVMETYLLSDIPVVKVIAGLIAVTEGKSFLENMHRITGIDFWSEILKKIHDNTAKTLPEEKKEDDQPK